MDLYSAVTPDYAKDDNQFTGTIKKVIVDVNPNVTDDPEGVTAIPD